jgi:hypothetical protein
MPYFGFLCVIDNAKVTFDAFQIMYCTFCYSNLVFSLNLRTKLMKGLILCYKIVVIHVDVDHLVSFKKIEEVINNAMKGSLKRKPTKNKKCISFFHI